MTATRRTFLKQAAAAAAAVSTLASFDENPVTASEKQEKPLIIDTHQHLWDLKSQKLPWLGGAPEVLRHSFTTKEYLQATQGLNVQAVYMEVDIDPMQHVQEAEHVIELSRSDKHPTVAAVIGGQPASADFAKYLARFKNSPEVKGVRQVLHNESAKAGACLTPKFVRGIQELGKLGLSFDLCMRPTELSDALKLTKLCPDTRFIVDHCGNADISAFGKQPTDAHKPSHKADPWRRDMEALAKNPQVVCKISGIIARAAKGWSSDDLAPIVNHCLDTFGPERVIFGGDWPVCLLGAPLRSWIDALGEIISNRPADQQKKLWHSNAQRIYGLKV